MSCRTRCPGPTGRPGGATPPGAHGHARPHTAHTTAVPADPPWPRIIEGRCTWCGDPVSEHDGGLREHHRIEVVWGRYDDEPESDINDEREAERRVLDVVRDLFAVLDAHGYRRTSDEAALGRAVVAVWQLVEEYEGQTDSGIARQRPDGS